MTKIVRIIFSILLTFISLTLFANGNENKSDQAVKDFSNVNLLNDIFEKLYNLEKNKIGKVNIVHIGDSHVQADIFTNTIRQVLQNKFGNGGYGFTFPYSLANTNGGGYIKYTSNEVWQSRRNVYPVSDVQIGLSGIGLYINSNSFSIDLVANEKYKFNTLKLLYPTVSPSFDLAYTSRGVSDKPIVSSTNKAQYKALYHKVNAGETLYRISVNYNVSVDNLKQANNLKSNNLKIGSLLLIPIANGTHLDETDIAPREVVPASQTHPFVSIYTSPELISKASILPNGKNLTYNLNGIVLENDKPGVIYHSIGVNGTKASDFNKHPLFFDQLSILSPDLIIISLGTNESFGKQSPAKYMAQINQLVNNIRLNNKEVVILIMTPPPSLFRNKKPNKFVEDYSAELMKMSKCVVWDLFSKMGGITAPKKESSKKLMARDKVHYTREGYEKQGTIFVSDFINTYSSYIK